MAHSSLLIIYMFSFSTLLFPYSSLASAGFIILTLASIGIGDSTLLSLTITFLLMALSIVMGSVSYTLETFIRDRFLLMKNIEEEREKIEVEKRLSQGLLLNIFPKVIIEKFKRDKATVVEEFSGKARSTYISIKLLYHMILSYHISSR